ncbi:hypothetical protein AAG906_002190 [Vitis piasezkii]
MSDISNESTTVPQPSLNNPIITNSSKISPTTIRLNGDNFLRWSQSVRMYIGGRGKMGYLTGEKKAPVVDDPNYAIWDAKNSMIFELTLKLGEIRQGEDNITKYFNYLKRIWQDLDLFNTYEWKSAEDGLHHKETMEDNRIFKFLAGLNVEFDEVRGRIIGRQPLPSIGEVFSEVRREESKRNVMLGKKGPGVSIEGSAFVTMGGGYNKAAAFQGKSDERPRVWCDFCNKPRHTRENSIIPTANEAETNPFTTEQMEHLLALLKSNLTSCTSNVSLAHIGLELEEDDWQC